MSEPIKKRGRPPGDPTPGQLEVRVGNTYRRFDKSIKRVKISITLKPTSAEYIKWLASHRNCSVSQVMDLLIEESKEAAEEVDKKIAMDQR